MLHRARDLLVRQRTMLVNALRAHMAEFGFIAAKGLRHVEEIGRGDRGEQTLARRNWRDRSCGSSWRNWTT